MRTDLKLALAAGLFALSLAAYRVVDVPGMPNIDDNYWYIPSAVSLLADGDLDLRELESAPQASLKHYRIHTLSDGRRFNYFPVGPSVLAAPLVAVASYDLATGTAAERLAAAQQTPDRYLALADLVADVWAASAVGLLFLVVTSLGAHTRVSLATATAFTLIFAFTTPHLSIHAGGLWSHVFSTSLLLVALLTLCAGDPRRRVLAGLPLGLAYLCRPTFGLTIVLVGCWIAVTALRDDGGPLRSGVRRVAAALAAYLACVAAVLVPFALWSWTTFGSILPRYYTQRRFSLTTFWEALAGLLVSPNRGLLVHAPLLVGSLLGLAVVVLAQARKTSSAWKRRAETDRLAIADDGVATTAPRQPPTEARPLAAHDLLALCAVILIVHLLIAACYRKWWGGGGFGPRLLADSLPLAVLLLLPAWELVQAQRLRLRQALFAVALTFAAVGLAINFRGATAASVYEWNGKPRRVDNRPARLWDWRDLQVLR